MLGWELYMWLSSLGWALKLVITPNHLIGIGIFLVIKIMCSTQ